MEIDSESARKLHIAAGIASLLELADELDLSDVAIHLNGALVALDGVGVPPAGADIGAGHEDRGWGSSP